MKLQQNKPILSSTSTVKSNQQISYKSILQKYKNKITQVKSIDEEEPLQGKFATTQLANEEQEKSKKPNNTGLPDNLKSGIENLSGYSMDDVIVHYNSDKPAQLQAHAYAQGTDIHIAPGQERHLGHEAWHVVQQKQGRVKPTMQMKDNVNVNDDVGLEKEADVMGARALQFFNNMQGVKQFKISIDKVTNVNSSQANIQKMKKVKGNSDEYKDHEKALSIIENDILNYPLKSPDDCKTLAENELLSLRDAQLKKWGLSESYTPYYKETTDQRMQLVWRMCEDERIRQIQGKVDNGHRNFTKKSMEEYVNIRANGIQEKYRKERGKLIDRRNNIIQL